MTLTLMSRLPAARGLCCGLLLVLASALPVQAQAAGPSESVAPAVPESDAAPAAPLQNPVVIAIQVEGARRYTREQLVAALGQTVGAPLDPAAIERGIHTLWKAFHVRAQVDVSEVAGGLELLLRVSELPADLEPRFVGNDEIDFNEILDWAQLIEGQELFLHQAPRVRQRILEGYRAAGYYFAEVEFVAREESG
ncbi:MAG: hypothetical protein QF615_02075, partial [Planctomycetota bacterium]|nr:hypothetical protein [Planctomycetota bacterium]